MVIKKKENLITWVCSSEPVTILPIHLKAGLNIPTSFLWCKFNNSTSLGTTPVLITASILSFGPSVMYDKAQHVSVNTSLSFEYNK